MQCVLIIMHSKQSCLVKNLRHSKQFLRYVWSTQIYNTSEGPAAEKKKVLDENEEEVFEARLT